MSKRRIRKTRHTYRNWDLLPVVDRPFNVDVEMQWRAGKRLSRGQATLVRKEWPRAPWGIGK